mgnify:CR=1 FL=1|jgi:hypothetical protein
MLKIQILPDKHNYKRKDEARSLPKALPEVRLMPPPRAISQPLLLLLQFGCGVGKEGASAPYRTPTTSMWISSALLLTY